LRAGYQPKNTPMTPAEATTRTMNRLRDGTRRPAKRASLRLSRHCRARPPCSSAHRFAKPIAMAARRLFVSLTLVASFLTQQFLLAMAIGQGLVGFHLLAQG